MADDLRHFLGEQSEQAAAAVDGAAERIVAAELAATPPPVPRPRSRGSQPIKIVPKGLRSFDVARRQLLPGTSPRPPRSRRPARHDPLLEDAHRGTRRRQTFTVGLIYGPSGCGKSSLVKAGLLPHLADDILVVYLEATAAETETRLLNGLRKRCPSLAADLSLKAALGSLRRGEGIPAGKKVLIVLDQFEQWLHAKKDQENTELVQALRQCDGVHLQAIVMVRDDFWMAATRFMRELEVRLVEGQNSAASICSRPPRREGAGGVRPSLRLLAREAERDEQASRRKFLDQAVAGLAQEGKVISVRLSLFAEMMKGKSWTPAALKAVGGTEGVGVTFLEETFSANTAPPEHRYHQKAARAVLKALLPDSGTDIKGHMRSREELLEASGYVGSAPRLRRPARHPRRRDPPADADRPRGEVERRIDDEGAGRREVLPTDARLPGPVAARLADAQAEGDAARPGRTAARRSRRRLVGSAGESAVAVAVAVARHPLADARRRPGRRRSGR